MKILAMDTAAAACSVALWQEGAVTHHVLEEMARGHAEKLLPLVQNLLQDADVSIEDLDALAVTVGPGAFTGLRIGLASARGFAAASGKPVIGVTTLESLAHGTGQQACPILCALDAKRADLYAQLFDGDGLPLSEPVARLPENVVDLLPEDCTQVVVAGDSFSRLKDLLAEKGVKAIPSDVRLPNAHDVVEIAAGKGLPKEGEGRPSAFYIRPPDAALPKNGGRLRP
ncbi:tRNA (adenosine(37)-N6)-threonylcarbamoyltransferase complex dimerization subunit type 1 TsaB [Terasakiella sp. SH-1]|uniref:tRNA (adenosine(37)-N6)-threonylcarbamoyltransferase complex dimerization subunit type 1 TsaB n=1 Tax=Terasakiella sp. SH-1 TaxID=2560057 RepID=UPI00107487F2|nr:tRNA (adenosine(37)-N6)-threonylcarbamoyltransferase complex dimerization subunit type 1 TsaB [Terasakiella sp. SH-1]